MSETYQLAPSLATLTTSLRAQMSDWQRRIVCPVCVNAMRPFASPHGFPYSRCSACGFVGADPVPPGEVLAAFYNSPFYGNYRVLEARRIQSDRYFSVSLYTSIERLADWIQSEHAGDLLDYGCGPGTFLAYLRERRGFRSVEGLELSRKSVAFARETFGLTVAPDTSGLSKALYDCITLIEVLEHVPHPGQFLDEVLTRLKPGGTLLITTPAVDSVTARWFPDTCEHYTGPSHLSLFTESALRKLLRAKRCVIERLELDRAWLGWHRFVRGLTQTMDVESPQSDTDLRDLRFKTTNPWLGRMLAHVPLMDPVVSVMSRLLLWKSTDHLYVLARRHA